MLVIVAFLIILLRSGNTKDEMVLSAFQNLIMNCNERTVLQCNLSSSMELNIIEIHWTKQTDFKCDPTSSNSPPGFECNYTTGALTLTILHPTPANTGIYSCCVMAESGHGCQKINVSLGKCNEEFDTQTAEETEIISINIVDQLGAESRTSTQHCLSWTLLLALMFSVISCLSL